MAKPNYSYEKRQRELANKKKQEEKRQRKVAGKTSGDSTDTSDSGDSGAPPTGTPPAPAGGTP